MCTAYRKNWFSIVNRFSFLSLSRSFTNGMEKDEHEHVNNHIRCSNSSSFFLFILLSLCDDEDFTLPGYQQQQKKLEKMKALFRFQLRLYCISNKKRWKLDRVFLPFAYRLRYNSTYAPGKDVLMMSTNEIKPLLLHFDVHRERIRYGIRIINDFQSFNGLFWAFWSG